MNRSLLVHILLNGKNVNGKKEMLEEWKMFGVAETQRNGGNVECRVW